MSFKTVESADGTELAYDVEGSGPSLVIVGGAFNTRMSPKRLTPYLTDHFTVFSWDRRGRGDSAEGGTYSRDREFDDLEAIIYAAGGSANVYGHSSGAVLALETAARGAGISKLAVYEPPFDPHSELDVDEVVASIERGDLDRAAALFLSSTGGNAQWMSSQPWWPSLVAVAGTLPHDFALVGDGVVPADRLAAIDVPTLVMYGSQSAPWAESASTLIAAAVPQSRVVRVEDQSHTVADEVIAPLLIEFFA